LGADHAVEVDQHRVEHRRQPTSTLTVAIAMPSIVLFEQVGRW